MTHANSGGMADEDKRRNELRRAVESTEADAAPRTIVSEAEGVTGVDIADSAAVRPALGPGAEEGDETP